MIPMRNVNRRRVLRGMMGGTAIGVGLPLLDCFLNTNGTALADGAPLPVCFGTYFGGLGLNPGRWEPKKVGANYDMNVEAEALTPFKSKVNIYSGMKCFLDSHAALVHSTGVQVCLAGGISQGADLASFSMPTIDQTIADVIGKQTRFRSLEASCAGTAQSNSRRGPGSLNPAENSPAALYARIFGPEFKDPNAADFTPDPEVMARKSALSIVTEQRQALMKDLGTADRTRLDSYFTSLRELEQQLNLLLQKPAPLKACTNPDKVSDAPVTGALIDDVHVNTKLFSGLMAHALACGQTRVFNLMFSQATSSLRRAGSPQTHHIYTHEEPVDPKIGCQANVSWFATQAMIGFSTLLTALDSIKEGDRTLLDRTLVFYSSDTGLAKIHGLDNMPLMTAGSAGGKFKTGIHVQGVGDPVIRVGLTILQGFGAGYNSWGTESNKTSKTITEVLA